MTDLKHGTKVYYACYGYHHNEVCYVQHRTVGAAARHVYHLNTDLARAGGSGTQRSWQVIAVEDDGRRFLNDDEDDDQSIAWAEMPR